MSASAQEEISLSVEETNALRAKLGLKPLADSQKKSGSLPEAPQEPSKPVQDVEKQEGKRMADALSSGGGVLDVFGADESTSDWLAKLPKRSQTQEASENHVDDSESSSDSEGSSPVSCSDSESSSNSDS